MNIKRDAKLFRLLFDTPFNAPLLASEQERKIFSDEYDRICKAYRVQMRRIGYFESYDLDEEAVNGVVPHEPHYSMSRSLPIARAITIELMSIAMACQRWVEQTRKNLSDNKEKYLVVAYAMFEDAESIELERKWQEKDLDTSAIVLITSEFAIIDTKCDPLAELFNK